MEISFILQHGQKQWGASSQNIMNNGINPKREMIDPMAGQFLSKHVAVKQVESKRFDREGLRQLQL